MTGRERAMSNSRELKLRAKSVMRERLKALILTALVFVLVNTLISVLTGELTGYAAWGRELSQRLDAAMANSQQLLESGDPSALIDSIEIPDARDFYRGVFPMLLALLLNLMTVPLSAGYTYHTLCESRHNPTKVSSIFYGFQMVWKTVALSLLQGLVTFVGFVLFIVPGVIFIYRYSMSLYILLDDPTKGVVQCMRESGMLMRGNKWRLFKLQFSFFWWLLLASIITDLIGLDILSLWLTPYMYLARGAFYNELLGMAAVGPGDEPYWN